MMTSLLLIYTHKPLLSKGKPINWDSHEMHALTTSSTFITSNLLTNHLIKNSNFNGK